MEPNSSAGFVDDVDRLVWKTAIGDITFGEFDRSSERVVRNSNVMVLLITTAESFENLKRFRSRRRIDRHRLETTFKGVIFFDVLSIFVKGSRADDLEFAARERRLDDIGGVVGAFSASRADERMKFVDKKDDIFSALHFVHDSLDTLFKLTAIFCTRDHCGNVKSDDTAPQENFWNVAIGDFLSETFNDGSFTDPRFSNKSGVIFRSTAEDLHGAFDFNNATDNGIKFAFFRQFCQVASKAVQSRRFNSIGTFRGRRRRFGLRLFCGVSR